LPAATYISLLVHTHIAANPAVPDQELRALIDATNAVNAIGRNLNQIARVANLGMMPEGPTRQQLADVAKGCLILRDRFRAFIHANEQSWKAKV
jgi:hypothetical protein